MARKRSMETLDVLIDNGEVSIPVIEIRTDFVTDLSRNLLGCETVIDTFHGWSLIQLASSIDRYIPNKLPE